MMLSVTWLYTLYSGGEFGKIRFELGVRIFPDDCDDRWEKIATLVPGKSILQIKQRYEYLRKNADAIDSGRIPLPDSVHVDEAEHLAEQGRKGGWSEEEHRFFLEGLEKYGRGGWRYISRNYVPTRTPAQVASHAQKYFRRLISQEKRRPSIHDINTIGQEDGSIPLEPITGKKKKVEDDTGGSSSGGSSRGRWKEPAQMTAEDLENFVPPCIFESLDPNLVPTPGLPPPPPGYSSLGNMGYGFDDQAPAQMTPDDQMYLDSMDFLEPGFSDGMF